MCACVRVYVIPFLSHSFFFSPRYAYTRAGINAGRNALAHDPLKRESFPRVGARDSLYIFQQLVSRSFSIVRLTLTRSVTPSLGTLQSQLSAIRMRVITRHSWLLRSTSTPAKFPRSSANARGSARACIYTHITHIQIYIYIYTHTEGNLCRENEVADFADAQRFSVMIISSVSISSVTVTDGEISRVRSRTVRNQLAQLGSLVNGIAVSSLNVLEVYYRKYREYTSSG